MSRAAHPSAASNAWTAAAASGLALRIARGASLAGVLGCPACGFERLVAFSCKKRGFCPSCLGRRMTETACHLRERVLPEVPLRQWVCSLPWELRLSVGYDGALCSAVVGTFVEEVQRSYRWRAKRRLGLRSESSVRPAR